VKPPSEIAALLRELATSESRKPLEDELARSLRSMLHRALLGKCRRVGVVADLEDATHELVLKLFDRIRAGQEPPRPGKEDPYVIRTAQNKARDILKGKASFGFRKHLETPDSIPRATSGRTHEDQVETRELSAILHEAIEALHPTYREVLHAHYFDDTPLVDIARQWHEAGRADTFEKAKQNVHKAASNGRKRLRVLIAELLDGGQDG
jgi:RNA polymerase sigma factor (sigma-70 family)